MQNLVIKATIGSKSFDYDLIYLPLEDNWINSKEYDPDITDPKEIFKILSKEHSGQLIEGSVAFIDLVKIKDIPGLSNPEDTVRCDELYDIYIFKDLAYSPEIYSRPFDNSPDEVYFCCSFAADCFLGNVYSKDFSYETCYECGRTICTQNPSNGWHVQGHYDESGWICNKCKEEIYLEYGINDDFDGETIPGQFFNYQDIEAAGWEQVADNVGVGMGRSSNYPVQPVIDTIRSYIDAGNLVLVNYESMAIGGLGGYVSIYIKDKAA